MVEFEKFKIYCMRRLIASSTINSIGIRCWCDVDL